MGYVNHAEGVNVQFVRTGSYEIEVNGQRFPATPTCALRTTRSGSES